MAEHLMKQDEAAKFLGLRPITLETWRMLGKGPMFVRLSRRAIRYELADLIRFVRTRKVEPKKKIAPRSVVANRGALSISRPQ
ncbi:MAG: helix-turn-helix transcriptional regulator [Beijerinckiaceae bacterium]